MVSAEVPGQALVQHVPGHHAEVGAHEQRHAEAVQGQPDVELGKAAGQAARGGVSSCWCTRRSSLEIGLEIQGQLAQSGLVPTRRIGPRELTRLLGAWPSVSGAGLRGAGRPDPAARAGRPAAGRRPAATRARARDGARDQPDHGQRGLRRAARQRPRRQPAGVRHLDVPAVRRRAGADLGAGARPGRRPRPGARGALRTAAPARRLRRRHRGPAPAPARHRLRLPRAARAACAARRTVHRARAGHHGRAGAGHQRRAAGRPARADPGRRPR